MGYSTLINKLVECFNQLWFQTNIILKTYTQTAVDNLLLNERLEWNEYKVQNGFQHPRLHKQQLFKAVGSSLWSNAV